MVLSTSKILNNEYFSGSEIDDFEINQEENAADDNFKLEIYSVKTSKKE